MSQKTTVQGYLLSSASFFVIIAGMREASALVVTFLLSFFVAIILTPGLRWLQKLRVPTPIALLLIVAFVGTIGGSVVALVGQSANQLVKQLPEYQTQLQSEFNEFEDWMAEQAWSEWLLETKNDRLPEDGAEHDDGLESSGEPTRPVDSLDDKLNDKLDDPSRGAEDSVNSPGAAPSRDGLADANQPPDPNGGRGKAESVSQLFSFEPSDAVELMKSLLADLGGLFSSAFLILLTVIFVLLETSRFPAKLEAAVGASGGTTGHVREIVDNIRRYMFIKTSTSLLTGLLVTGFLLSYDVRYAMLWGLLAFLFNYVPNIGSILAAGPAVALVFIERGPTPAIITGIGYLVINIFISYAIEPRFMGEGLGLSTLVVFLSLIFWGWVLGPIGMLLSAPLTMIVKIILADYEETRWIAVMLGAKAPEPAPAED